MNQVLVLGGTGFVGRSLCQQLVARQGGLRVVVPTRRLDHGQALRHLSGVELVTADVHNPTALAALVRGADAVVNLVAILHGRPPDFARVHVALPFALAHAMRDAGVQRLVHVSALGVAHDAPSHYLRSKAAGEQVLRDAALALTVLRPSLVFGRHDRLFNLFARLQRLAPLLPLAGRDARFQPVWVEDLAAAIVHVLERAPSAGQTYEIGGPEVCTLGELVRLAGRWAGVERRQIALPDWAARAQALALACLPGEPLLTRDNLDSMRVPNVAGGGLPGLAELGIAPMAMQAVVPEYLAAGQGPARLDHWRALARRD